MTAVDERKQMDFIGQVIGDWVAMASVPVGELLGLSRAMAGSQQGGRRAARIPRQAGMGPTPRV